VSYKAVLEKKQEMVSEKNRKTCAADSEFASTTQLFTMVKEQREETIRTEQTMLSS